MSPEGRPGIDEDWKGHGSVVGFDARDGVEKAVVADAGFAAEAFAVNAHEIAVSMIIDHGLPGFAVLGAAQEQAAIRPEIVVHLEDDFEVTKLFVGNDDTAVGWDVLAADDGALFDHPFSAGFILAGAAMAGFAADMPSFEGFAIEDRGKSIGCGFSGMGQPEEEGGKYAGNCREKFHEVGSFQVWR